MPRTARIKSEESIYHVIQRGNERKAIFRSPEDKDKFLRVLAKAKEKFGFKIYAYCLMDNHIHLLFDSSGSDISQVMKSVNVSYVSYFNRVYDRCGHLFQDRFRSEVIDSNPYLLELSRYIHLNPVKAGIVSHPDQYDWSSYSAYSGRTGMASTLVDVSYLLGILSRNEQAGMAAYQQFVMKTEAPFPAELSRCLPDFWPDESQPPAVSSHEELMLLLGRIAAQHSVTIEDMIEGAGKNRRSRNLAIQEVKRSTRLTLEEIGKLFGGLTASAVSRIVNSHSVNDNKRKML